MSKRNSKLSQAKKVKNDEFYTQYRDIEREMEAYLDFNPDVFRGKTVLLPCDDPEWSNFTKYFVSNFKQLGLKKVISTSYAHNSKQIDWSYEPSTVEKNASIFNPEKSVINGKIFILEHDNNNDGVIDFEDIEWRYLEGDGDFRSQEVLALREEADIIITNPPFSLFREFLAWVMDGKKQFSIIGNMNAITYKEVFPLIKDNRIWLGKGFQAGNAYFSLPKNMKERNNFAEGVYDKDTGLVKFRNCIWFTNIEHGRRHKPLELMTMADNIKFNAPAIEKNPTTYQKYDNYNAIEITKSAMIPSDYKGEMGVPISFLNKYCPEQFEIIKFRKGDDDKDLSVNGNCPYFRIIIKHKQ